MSACRNKKSERGHAEGRQGVERDLERQKAGHGCYEKEKQEGEGLYLGSMEERIKNINDDWKSHKETLCLLIMNM